MGLSSPSALSWSIGAQCLCQRSVLLAVSSAGRCLKRITLAGPPEPAPAEVLGSGGLVPFAITAAIMAEVSLGHWWIEDFLRSVSVLAV
jgi:hypothetical protein